MSALKAARYQTDGWQSVGQYWHIVVPTGTYGVRLQRRMVGSGRGSRPGLDHPIARRIRSYQKLVDGWHFGEGRGASQSTVDAALRVHGAMLSAGVVQTDAFPGISGEILVSAYCGQHTHELTVEVDGSATYCHEAGGQEVEFRERLSIEMAVMLARRIATAEQGALCGQSGSSTSFTMIRTDGVSRAWLSGNWDVRRRSLSSVRNVSDAPVLANANISVGTTPAALPAA